MKKKNLKCIGLVLLVIIIFLIIHTIRNMIIFKNIIKKVEPFENANNYYIKTTSTQGNIIESFYKDGRHLMELINISQTGVRKITRYGDNSVENTYIEAQTESGGEKIAILNSNSLPTFQKITNWFHTENNSEYILMSLLAHIRSVELNGKECYEITYIYSSNILFPAEGNFVLYIEKENGLTIRNKSGTMTDSNGNEIPIIVDYEYKFDSVTDEDLVEPDVSEYKIQEN